MQKKNVLEVPQIEYYSPNKMLSYNRLFNFITGARGIGKTMNIKIYLIRRFLKYGEQFIYLRRHKTNLKKDVLDTFFDKIRLLDEFKDIDFKVKGKQFFIKNKLCGWAIPLSSWQQIKSTEFPLVNTIFYDEFLKEKDGSHYLDNEPQALVSMAETVFREKIIFNTSNVRIICASNSTTIANPFFIYFKLFPDTSKRFNTFEHNPEILVEFPVLEEFTEMKREGRFGQLIKDTPYADLSIENKFLYDKGTFIAKKTKESEFKFMITFRGFEFGIWLDVERRLMFVSTKKDRTTKYHYALTKEDFDENNIYVSNYKEEYHTLKLVSAFKKGLLRFETEMVRSVAYDIFSFLNVK